MKKITFLLLLITMTKINCMYAQCEASLFYASPFPVDNSGNTTAFVVLFNNEYTILSELIVDDAYTLTTSDPMVYLTLRNIDDNSVITNGTPPLTFTATSNAIEVHLIVNSNCNAGDFVVSSVLATNESTLSIDVYNAEAFKAYPNPVLDVVKINSTSIIQKLTIVNLLGETIIELEPNSKEVEVDLTNYMNGLYFLKCESENKTTSKKLIKK